MVILPAMSIVSQPSSPSITSPIFIAASITPAIANILKKTPRNIALKPRKNRAAGPP